MTRGLLIVALFFASVVAGVAQELGNSNSSIVAYIERKLSTDNRQIRLFGIDGLLASNALVERITISDSQGTWLTIENAEIVWTRSALLRGRVEIDSLSAETIRIERTPAPDPSLPTPEATPFALPDLPVSVNIDALNVARLFLGEPLLGEAAQLRVTGALAIASGSMQANLDLTRRDGPGGQFKLIGGFNNETRELNTLVRLDEPEGGIAARALSIPGLPSVDLTLEGAGPIDDLTLALNLRTGGRPTAAGEARLFSVDDGIGFDGSVDGDLAPLMAAQYRPFFSGQSTIKVQGSRADTGALDLSQLRIKTAALDIEGLLTTTNSNRINKLKLAGTIGRSGAQTTLPIPGDISVETGILDIDVGSRPDGQWTGSFDLANLRYGQVTIGDAKFRADGVLTGTLVNADRVATTNLTGSLSGFTASDPGVRRALGREITLDLSTVFRPEQPFQITNATVSGNGVAIQASGEVADLRFDGQIDARVRSLAPFNGLASRRMAGGIDLALEGSIQPTSGIFDLTAEGTSNNLRAEIPFLDDLMRGRTRISGAVSRNEDGIRTRDLELRNSQISLTSDGVIASDNADFEFQADLTDIAVLHPEAQGRLRLSGNAAGSDGNIGLSAVLSMPDGELLDRPVENLRASFDGSLADGRLSGNMRGSGNMADAPVDLLATIGIAPEQRSLSNLRLLVGPSLISGAVSQDTASGGLTGEVRIGSRDISDLAALFLQEASGSINGSVKLEPGETLGQQIETRADAVNLTISGISLGSANLDAVVYDATNVPGVIGSFEFADLTAFGVEFTEGRGNATYDEGATGFNLFADLKNGTSVVSSGELVQLATGFEVGLGRFNITQTGAVLGLGRPARLTFAEDGLQSIDLALHAGAGRLVAKGAATDMFDLSVTARELPLSAVNAIFPQLQAVGIITGNVSVSGPRADPDVAFDLEGSGLSTAILGEAGLPGVELSLTGDVTGGIATATSRLTGPEGLNSSLEGSYRIATQEMGFDGVLDRFPLAILDAVTGRLGLRGAIDGTFRLGGTMRDPRVSFSLDGRNISARLMQQNGVAPFNATAEGSYYNQRITLPNARVTGAGADFQLNGRIPLWDEGLEVYIGGVVPLSIANVPLARSGIRADGQLRVRVNATGTLIEPNSSGQLSLAGGTVVIPRANLRLENVAVDGRFSGNRLTIARGTANNSRGGTVSASGSITLDPTAGIPADLTLTARGMNYTDGRIANVDFDANLALTGPLTRRAKFSGSIDVEKVEVTVPNASPTEKNAFALNVRHTNPTPGITATLERAAGTDVAQRSTATGSDTELDITVNAPARVFVRGRGLDGETGGRIRVTGTARDPKPVGRLDLIRGRIQVLSQRVTMNSGAIIFEGELIPDLMVRARTVTDEVEATIALDGIVTRPKISFSSVPDLPDDEILARIAFGRPLSELSPLQIAQVASAAAEFAGRRDLSFFDQVRRATGLDDLDFETTDDGATLVRAGKYIQDNIYSTIEADDQGNSKATINLDINTKVKARGSVDSLGNTSLGIFFERDY